MFCFDVTAGKRWPTAIRTNAMVTRITPDAVFVGVERIPARTVFWAAGNQASSLIRSLGVPVDRAGRAPRTSCACR